MTNHYQARAWWAKGAGWHRQARPHNWPNRAEGACFKCMYTNTAVVRGQDHGGSSYTLSQKSRRVGTSPKCMTDQAGSLLQGNESVDVEGATGAVYLDSSKAVDNLSHGCLLQDKLRNTNRLDKWMTVRWIKNWLNCQDHRAICNLFLNLLLWY